MPRKLVATLAVALLVAACARQPTGGDAGEPGPETYSANLVTYTEDREACSDRNAYRNAYFGDLHIHTAYSYDARPLGTETTPADAYRFARGEAHSDTALRGRRQRVHDAET